VMGLGGCGSKSGNERGRRARGRGGMGLESEESGKRVRGGVSGIEEASGSGIGEGGVSEKEGFLMEPPRGLAWLGLSPGFRGRGWWQAAATASVSLSGGAHAPLEPWPLGISAEGALAGSSGVRKRGSLDARGPFADCTVATVHAVRLCTSMKICDV